MRYLAHIDDGARRLVLTLENEQNQQLQRVYTFAEIRSRTREEQIEFLISDLTWPGTRNAGLSPIAKAWATAQVVLVRDRFIL